MNLRFTTNDENAGGGYAGVARTGDYGARDGGGVAAVRGRFAAPEFHGRGPRVPPIGLASLRPIGCTLGF